MCYCHSQSRFSVTISVTCYLKVSQTVPGPKCHVTVTVTFLFKQDLVLVIIDVNVTVTFQCLCKDFPKIKVM